MRISPVYVECKHCNTENISGEPCECENFQFVFNGYYFKDDGTETTFISGLPLPRQDKVVRDILFVDCDFHPSCWTQYSGITFENCKIIDSDAVLDKNNLVPTNALIFATIF